MRTRLATAFASLALLLALSGEAHADISDPGNPTYANKILGDFATPSVEPGGTVGFAFNVSNSYDDPDARMTDVILTMGIYRYVTQEESREVDDDFPHPPLINGDDTEIELSVPDLEWDDELRIEAPIETSKKTPHGSYFSQSTYFVRFRLEFRFEGNATQVVLQSRGFFTEDQWNRIVSFEGDDPIVNRTYLKSIGVDGLIPDSSFGIKIPIPRWPLGALIAACVATSLAALYYFVLDNPGQYPWLEKRFYYLRGKLSELRSQLEDRLRK
jgi:hypothetical protein